jgi:hypothetical protein
MRTSLIIMVATLCLGVGLATETRAQTIDWNAQMQALKAQQKLEWHALQVQHQTRRNSWKGLEVSGLDRSRANHEMQREARDLKQKQKDARQDLKDRQKALGAMQRGYAQ